jgi:hypothetical protein
LKKGEKLRENIVAIIFRVYVGNVGIKILEQIGLLGNSHQLHYIHTKMIQSHWRTAHMNMVVLSGCTEKVVS